MRKSTLLLAPVLAASMLLLWGADEALALMEGKTVQGGAYVSGGVGVGERDALERRRGGFNFWLATAAKSSGSYLANARVKITDAAGKTVLETNLDGPWLLVDLKPGRYTVDANFRGQTQRKSTNMDKGDHHEMLFYFDVEAETLPRGAKD